MAMIKSRTFVTDSPNGKFTSQKFPSWGVTNSDKKHMVIPEDSSHESLSIIETKQDIMEIVNERMEK